MTPERWEQVGALYRAALERAPGERADFLARACAGDADLRREVEALLAADAGAGGFLSAGAMADAAQMLAHEQARTLVGRSLGRYRVVAPLGAGGMGEVYLAEDVKLKRRVAVKLLPAELTASRDRVRRFEREARAASALNHPNIVTVFEVGEEEGLPFIATEYVEGETLRQLLARGPLSPAQALDVAAQAAGALAAAHEVGVVHRDVKPENIMLRRDGYVKVLDFGLAKLTQPQALMNEGTPVASTVETKPGVVLGTVAYMSPEQARSLEVDERTDVFSLGVVLYEMLTGRAPFTGETPSHVIVSILEREPEPLALHADVPAELERIVTQALQKDRAARYQTMRALLDDLRELKDELAFRSRQGRASGQSESTRGSGAQRAAGDSGAAGAAVAATGRAEHRTTARTEYLGGLARHKRGVALAVLLCAMAGTGVGLYRWLRARPPAVPFANIRITKVPVARQVYAGRISPDGKYIAYISLSPEGEQSLWVKQAATDSSVQVVPPAQVNYWGLTFSPDSDSLYYVIKDHNNPVSVLYRVPILGGAPRKLMTRLSGVVVSPDGRRLAFVRGSPSSEERLQLLTADAEGGDERVVAEGAGAAFRSFDWSPDGKSIAYINPAPRGEQMDWYVGEMSTAGGPERPLTQPAAQRLRGLIWMPDGRHLLLVADESLGRPQLWLLSRDGGELRRVTHDLNSYLYISITADSRQILATIRSRPASLWVAPLGDARQARQVTPGTDEYDHIVWTPEGQLVCDIGPSLWQMDTTGGERRRLSPETWTDSYPVVTPDGRYVVFGSLRSGRQNIWRMERDGSAPVQLTTEGGNFPALAPDGQWVIYTNSATGRAGVWKVPLAGGTPERIVDAAADKAAVSPDGRLLAYSYEDPQTKLSKLAVVTVAGGQTRRVFDHAEVGYGNILWTPDGRALVFINGETGDLELRPLTGGAPRKLVEHGVEELFSFDLSPDGKRLAYTKGTLTSTLVLISDLE